MDNPIENQAEILVQKIKRYLIASMGRSLKNANDEEVYRALAHVIREEIMVNFLATERTFAKHQCRRLFYLSMEYLPGRFFSNNINNTSHIDLIQAALRLMNRNFNHLIMEEREPGLGNGGLGRLASCLLDSLATLHYPAKGYGLRYQYGIFEQQIRDGVQIEAPDCWLMHENPWEIKQEIEKVTVKYGGRPSTVITYQGDKVQALHDYEEVSAMPYDIPIVGYDRGKQFSVLPLRLWSTKESPRNFQLQRYNAGQIDQAAENILISDVLYPNELNETGKRIRLKQEFLLVSASLQDIIRNYLEQYDSFREFADKTRIQINDTHPALLIAELIRILTKQHGVAWGRAVEMTREITSYTNHTILSEALEQWDQHLMKQLLPRQYRIIEILNHEFCAMIRSHFPNNEELVRKLSILEHGKVRMAHLSIVGSHKINGVAKLHTEILKSSVFKDFYEIWPDRFTNITNGVTQRRWLLHCNPDLAAFITRRIGEGWITDFQQIGKLAEFASDPESKAEFEQIRKRNKSHLISYIKRFGKTRDAEGKISGSLPLLSVDSLFDVQIKRFHEYKRQLMNILHAIMIYHDILDYPETHGRIKRTVIFGGKAAGGYETAKNIIRLISAVARKVNKDPAANKLLNIVFIENYNVGTAELLIPAADISEQISMAGTEASGTSVMKFAMNGALTVGTHDGANVEINADIQDKWWPFRFGAASEEIALMNASGSYRPDRIYEENPKIKRALDSLRDRTFAKTEAEHQAFSDLYAKLLESHYGGRADRFYVIYDLPGFYAVQRKVEELYVQPEAWAEFALHNIAGMGKFSTDFAIRNYAEKIWEISPCPMDEEVLNEVRLECLELKRPLGKKKLDWLSNP